MIYRFPSIAQPESIGFAFNTQVSFTNEQTSGYFRAYKTFGDGETQHSGDWSVGTDALADYLTSLTQAMLKDDALALSAVSALTMEPSLAAIQFAASLICKPSDLDGGIKRRFWSLEQLRVSSSASKQHDKRYVAFAEWMDGSPKAILRILTPDYASPFLSYCYVEAVRNWILDQSLNMELPGLYIGWFAEHHFARQLHAAYTMGRSAAQAAQYRDAAQVQLDCYRSNFLRSAAVAA